MADPQGQMLEPTVADAMAIDGPVTALQVPFERCDQVVNAGIEDRAAVHVDDPVAAAAVIPGLEVAILAALQGDDGPVAIAQGAIGYQQRLHLGTEASDALQCLLEGALLPLLLAGVAEGLEGAATAMVRQDAGRAAPLGRRLQDAAQIGVQLTALLGQKPDGDTVAGQGAIDEHHPAIEPADAPAVMGEVLDLELDLGCSSVQLGHVVIHLP